MTDYTPKLNKPEEAQNVFLDHAKMHARLNHIAEKKTSNPPKRNLYTLKMKNFCFLTSHQTTPKSTR